MLDIDKALADVFNNDIAPDGTFRAEALEIYKELQHRKQLATKKHDQDYTNFRGDMIRKASRNKAGNLCRYGKSI